MVLKNVTDDILFREAMINSLLERDKIIILNEALGEELTPYLLF